MQSYFALITPLSGHPDQGLPGGGQAGYPSQPIYHPGHPDHGLPSQPGHPANRPPGSWGGATDPGFGQGGRPHPGNRPPGSSSGRPDNALPEGEEIQIDNDLPPVPPEYEDKTIVAIKRPAEEWVFRAYDPVEIDNSLPPSPEPK